MKDAKERLRKYFEAEGNRVSGCLDSALSLMGKVDEGLCKFILSLDRNEREALFLLVLCYSFRFSEELSEEGRMVALALSSKHAKA